MSLTKINQDKEKEKDKDKEKNQIFIIFYMHSPDMRDEKNRRMEFATNPVTILNSLENMGYKVLVNLS